MPRRVLVKEVNWLGDVVMSLPALEAILSEFGRRRPAPRTPRLDPGVPSAACGFR